MIRVKNSKSIICSKKELEMIDPYLLGNYYVHIFELPLFSLKPKETYRVEDVETDYVLIRPINAKLSERFMNNINKTWNKFYED